MSPREPVFFHVDMDAFYASVEQYDHPALQGEPVIVGGTSRRGVVSACSYEARRFGIHSAMPLYQARRLCPRGHFLPVRMERYAEISREIMEVFRRFTPEVHQLSVDEAFLRMTGTQRLFGPPEEAARQLKEAVRCRFPLSLSVGIAPNPYLAKIASDQDKPNGLVRVDPEGILPFLDALPLEDLWGVGDKTCQRLRQMGLTSPRAIRERSLQGLRQLFGQAGGLNLYNAVRGIDPGYFCQEPKTRSISSETTLPRDTRDIEALRRHLLELSHHVMYRLFEGTLRSVTPFIKYRLSDFSLHSAQNRLPRPVETAEELYRHGCRLLDDHWDRQQPLRLIGIGLAGLTDTAGRQQELFAGPYEKNRRVEEKVWQMKEKYGEIPVVRASLLKPPSRENPKPGAGKRGTD